MTPGSTSHPIRKHSARGQIQIHAVIFSSIDGVNTCTLTNNAG